eukprot:4538878-Amphidinium_carterae.1
MEMVYLGGVLRPFEIEHFTILKPICVQTLYLKNFLHNDDDAVALVNIIKNKGVPECLQELLIANSRRITTSVSAGRVQDIREACGSYDVKAGFAF